MKYVCTKCSMEKGAYSQLSDDGSGILVCRLNPEHKFRIDESGFLKSADK